MVPQQHPSIRYWHAMTYDSINQKVILFGGSSNSVDLNDVWIYDYSLNVWSYIPTSVAPNPRSYTALVYDSTNEKTILFGGGNESHAIMDDTWAYDYATNTWDGMIASSTFTFSTTPSFSTSITLTSSTAFVPSSTSSVSTSFITLQIVIIALGASSIFMWCRRKLRKSL
ncbi:MAG: kelch repeat-containing protein, partial [Candidatus Hodarchaeota archaeon]